MLDLLLSVYYRCIRYIRRRVDPDLSKECKVQD